MPLPVPISNGFLLRENSYGSFTLPYSGPCIILNAGAVMSPGQIVKIDSSDVTQCLLYTTADRELYLGVHLATIVGGLPDYGAAAAIGDQVIVAVPGAIVCDVMLGATLAAGATISPHASNGKYIGWTSGTDFAGWIYEGGADGSVVKAFMVPLEDRGIAGGEITEAMLASYSADGLNAHRIARATYDFAVDGGGVGAIGLGVFLPDNAIVTRSYYEVITTFTSPTGPDNATVALGIATDDATGIVAALAINDVSNIWDAGLHEGIQDDTMANASTKTTGSRELILTVGVEDLTAGKLVLFCEYVVTE